MPVYNGPDIKMVKYFQLGICLLVVWQSFDSPQTKLDLTLSCYNRGHQRVLTNQTWIGQGIINVNIKDLL